MTMMLKEKGTVLTPSNNYPDTADVPVDDVKGLIVIVVPDIAKNDSNGVINDTIIESSSVSVIIGSK